MNRFTNTDRDDLLLAEVNLCEIERLAKITGRLLRCADPETRQALAIIERNAHRVRLGVPETFAALAAA